jgi:integrase/recombinase XerC
MTTNRQLVARYADSLRAQRHSEETIRTARSVLLGLGDRATRRLEDLERVDVLTWLEQRSREIGERTQRKDLTYVRGFYRWAVIEGHAQRDPTIGVPAPRVPALLPRPIAEDRLGKALDDADVRLAAVLALAAFAGLRACEIAGLVWGDVRLDGPEPDLRVVGKGSKERVVPVSDALAERLRALPNAGRRGPVIARADGRPGHNTPNRVSSVANQFLHEAGIPDTLHSLRHRFGTRMADDGDLHQAQEALGHANIQTTIGYTRLNPRHLRPTIQRVGYVGRDGPDVERPAS